MTIELYLAGWENGTLVLSRDDTTLRPMRFPAGESHVAIAADAELGGVQVAHVCFEGDADLMALAMWADACRRNGVRTIAVLPYLPGARQDRGVPLGAGVYADLINSMKLDQIICFDPHSDVMPALLNNLTAVSIADLHNPRFAHDENEAGAGPFAAEFADVVGVIAPDAGARKRTELVAEQMGVPVYQALKHRDFATGKLSNFSCEPLPTEGRLLLVDDICDGGRTFIGLAEAIGLPAERLALWVSHGVFSGQAKRLADHFEVVATTDSAPGSASSNAPDPVVTPLLPILLKFATAPKGRNS